MKKYEKRTEVGNEGEMGYLISKKGDSRKVLKIITILLNFT